MTEYTPERETVMRFEAARNKLIDELGRPPTSTQLAAALGYSPQRVRQISAWLGLPTQRTALVPTRVDLTQTIPPERDELERRLILNLRRLYALELEGAARSDGELAKLAGYTGRIDQAAANFRKVFAGHRAPSVDICRKMARAFGVDPVEIWRPIEDSQ